MSFIKRHTRLLLVAVSCAGVGAGAGAIATAGAATGATGHHVAGKAARAGALRRFAARAVHGVVVVRTKSGFADVTFDRGTVDSVNGQQLTLTEGTPKAAYQTVTVTIPAGARVRDNGQAASLSAVKAGQRVLVLVAPQRTFVIARTPRAA